MIEDVRTERKSKGLTLKELAGEVDVDYSSLSKFERGEKTLTHDQVGRIAARLDLNPRELVIDSLVQGLMDKAPVDISLADVESACKRLSSNLGAADWRQKSFENPNATIKLVSLFSGIGAVEYALQRCNLKVDVLAACDIDKFCKASYMANYHLEENKWHEDVSNLNCKPLRGQVDLLLGGSPCQSFSMVGKRKGLEDTRGTLFYDFARCVDECKPRVFIYENVKGLTNHDKGRTFQIMKETLKSIGYDIHHQILNAKDFGIPQHRERIFVVGFLKPNLEFNFPDKIELQSKMQDFLLDYTDSKYYLKEKGIKFVTRTKNRKKRYTQVNGDVALCQKANQQFNWHGDFVFENVHPSEEGDFIFEVSEVEEKYYLSSKIEKYVLAGGTKNFKTSTKTDLEVARPLLQSMHKMHRAGVDNYVTHKGRIRKLTPQECLRLMGFGDDFKKVVSDTQLYRQAGNSIVVDVLIALLKSIDITKYSK